MNGETLNSAFPLLSEYILEVSSERETIALYQTDILLIERAPFYNVCKEIDTLKNLLNNSAGCDYTITTSIATSNIDRGCIVLQSDVLTDEFIFYYADGDKNFALQSLRSYMLENGEMPILEHNFFYNRYDDVYLFQNTNGEEDYEEEERERQSIYTNDFRCSLCGVWYPKELITKMSGKHVCNKCASSLEPCVYNKHGLQYKGQQPLCGGCSFRHVCDYVLRNYNEAPQYRYYKLPDEENPRYYGIEIEMDNVDRPDGNSQKNYCEIKGESPLFYAKRDGSLMNGFELNTHPATLKYLMNCSDIKDAMLRAKQLGYKAHDTRTCGLHIHVSRDGLSDAVIARILHVFYLNDVYFRAFARRDYNRYCSKVFLDDNDDTPKKIIEKRDNNNRYVAINMKHKKTIEFRIFKGTLNVETIYATLQLIDNLIEYAIQNPDLTKKDGIFDEIVAMRSYKELNSYVRKQVTEKNLKRYTEKENFSEFDNCYRYDEPMTQATYDAYSNASTIYYTGTNSGDGE